jgi:hypothetical protein
MRGHLSSKGCEALALLRANNFSVDELPEADPEEQAPIRPTFNPCKSYPALIPVSRFHSSQPADKRYNGASRPLGPYSMQVEPATPKTANTTGLVGKRPF